MQRRGALTAVQAAVAAYRSRLSKAQTKYEAYRTCRSGEHGAGQSHESDSPNGTPEANAQRCLKPFTQAFKDAHDVHERALQLRRAKETIPKSAVEGWYLHWVVPQRTHGSLRVIQDDQDDLNEDQ